jgi:uncharacterized protein (DUF1684 family)
MAAGAFLAIAFAAACNNPKPPDEGDYVSRLAADRAAKDAQFLKEREPVPQNRKSELLPLEYFPISPNYSVPAVLKVFDNIETVEIVTSTGSFDKFRRVGQLEFTLMGQPLKLTAYVAAASETMDRLFVPFSDATTGVETYDTGRYLDLDRTSTGLYQIDFNLAYNPYCYFSPTYICPLPTKENRLPVRIEAGERVKKIKT